MSILKLFFNYTGLIYTLRWSNDNNNLLTASSDYTACVWTLKNYNQTDFQVITHNAINTLFMIIIYIYIYFRFFHTRHMYIVLNLAKL